MHLPRVTKILLFALAGAYLLQYIFPEQMMLYFALWPWGEHIVGSDEGMAVYASFYPWQLLTYAFLHDPDSFVHLFFNAIALFQFGSVLETTWGERRYIQYLIVLLSAPVCCS
jgi:membrane associated rhomboid family serine protease